MPLASNILSDELFGLRMRFYVNFYQNLTTINSYVDDGGLGALIRIDNGSYLTNHLPMDGNRIASGFKTSISLNRSFKSILPWPYSNGLIDNETNILRYFIQF